MERAEGWGHGNIDAALRDRQGLGFDWMGQWALHKWFLLASVTTVFLLACHAFFFPYRLSLLVSQPTVDHPSMTVSNAHAHLDSVPHGTYSSDYRFSPPHLAHIRLFTASARFTCRYNWDTSQLSPLSGGIRAFAFSLIRLRRLYHLQEGELFSWCKD